MGHVVAGQLLAALLTAAQVATAAGGGAPTRARSSPSSPSRASPRHRWSTTADRRPARLPGRDLLRGPLGVRDWQGVVALLVGYVGAVVAASVRWIGGFGARPSSAGRLLPYVVTIGAIVTAAWALGFAGQQRERYVASLVARAEQAERMAEREVRAGRARRALAHRPRDARRGRPRAVGDRRAGRRRALRRRQGPRRRRRHAGDDLGHRTRVADRDAPAAGAAARRRHRRARRNPAWATYATSSTRPARAGTQVEADLPDAAPGRARTASGWRRTASSRRR